MNRNAESHFAVAPIDIEIARSRFDRSRGCTFTTNFGAVTPCLVEEVLPGDTFDITTSKVVRLQTLLKPIFGNMYMDTYYFFCPHRLIWDHFKQFCGESEQAWTPAVEYSIPQIKVPDGGFPFGSLADYLGVPPKTGSGEEISALPFRAYAKIIDDWFRNQNLEDPINIYTGDATWNPAESENELISGYKLYTAGKYHDLFTSALPQPQKSDPVTIPVEYNSQYLPVMPYSDLNVPTGWVPQSLQFSTLSGETHGNFGVSSNGEDIVTDQAVADPDDEIFFTNLGIDVSRTAGSISVNDMRMSFAIQRFYERLARGGSRYIELCKSLFGVTSPDGRLQRTEYLGGNRMPISVSQVTNNAQSSDAPLGNVGAMSMTNDINKDMIHSFTEHGLLIGVVVLRYEHGYPQGLPKLFSRKNKFDFYWPTFANISEQPIYKKELFFGDSPAENEKVFGYQEPWAHYRYGFNSVHGEMRPDHPTSLASWNLADDYSTYPSLSQEWAREDKTNVDRCLAVTSEVSDQALIDMWFANYATRPMPLFSVPGLIDHH